MVPPRDGKPKKPQFSDSEIAEREALLDRLVLEEKVDAAIAARRKTMVDFIKGTSQFITSVGVVVYFGRDAIAWMWKAWLQPIIKSTLGGP